MIDQARPSASVAEFGYHRTVNEGMKLKARELTKLVLTGWPRNGHLLGVAAQVDRCHRSRIKTDRYLSRRFAGDGQKGCPSSLWPMCDRLIIDFRGVYPSDK